MAVPKSEKQGLYAARQGMTAHNSNTMRNSSPHLLLVWSYVWYYTVIPCLAAVLVSLVFGTAIPTCILHFNEMFYYTGFTGFSLLQYILCIASASVSLLLTKARSSMRKWHMQPIRKWCLTIKK